MTIDLPRETIQFLADLANEIDSQDNRATAKPYFYVVRGETKTTAADGCGDEQGYYDEVNCCELDTAVVESEYTEWMKSRDEYTPDDESVLRFINFKDFLTEKEYREYDVQLFPVEENVFLTEKGLLKHMELNGHNYRHLHTVLPAGYVKHAFRNPEMESLIQAIATFKDVLEPAAKAGAK